jgi:hypothetical protein
VLTDICSFYAAPDATAFEGKTKALAARFTQVEQRLSDGLYFDGERLTHVCDDFSPFMAML